MKNRMLMAALCAAFGLTAGCRLWQGRDVDELSRPIRGEVLPADMIGKAATPDPAAEWSLRRLGEARGTRVFALQVSGDVRPFKLKRIDLLAFVVSGTGIASVGGQRRAIGPGSVVIVPRGSELEFVRTEDARKTPLLLTLALTPSTPPPKALTEALAAPAEEAPVTKAEKAEEQRPEPPPVKAGEVED